SRGQVCRAIVACGSANGVAYVANRYPCVRAAIALDPEMAEMSRLHNDANVLSLSADRLDIDAAWPIVEAWLATGYEGGRHAPRIAKIDQYARRAWQRELARHSAVEETDPEIARLLRA